MSPPVIGPIGFAIPPAKSVTPLADDSVGADLDEALYIFVGVNHFIPEQHDLFNELLVNGRDGYKLTGIDAVAEESFWFGPEDEKSFAMNMPEVNKRSGLATKRCGYDLQGYIDFYVKSGSKEVLWFLGECINQSPPFKSPRIHEALLAPLKIVRDSQSSAKPMVFFASDLFYASQYSLLNNSFSTNHLMEIREYNAVNFLRARLQGKPIPTIEFPAGVKDVKLFVQNRIERKNDYVPLPTDKAALSQMFLQAQKDGKVVFGIKEVYAYLQRVIDGEKSKGKGKVVLSQWGSAHVEKQGVPKYVRNRDRFFSIILIGGANYSRTVFEDVVNDAGLKDKIFAWELPANTREAHLVVYLPIKSGSENIEDDVPPEGFEPQGAVTLLRSRPF